ncbi:MAG: hypothetical protein EHM64_15160 [Ignavibacteriae bacterium]|nr:MAG: hypothetical protein EHM64_15160 [Ignavibacteriota bacterium]
MKQTICTALAAVLFFSGSMQSQYLNTFADSGNKTILTGSLQHDFILQASRRAEWNDPENSGPASAVNKYSPLAAGLFSAVIPGAGQFYTKSYWQSAAFFGAEVITWILYVSNEHKGDDRTNLFQQFANDHWSVVQYAGWINANFGMSININPDQNLKPWNRIHWDELNTVEEQIAQMSPPTGFTHKLAPYNDQQYYEMIGKYSQFGGGWDDAGGYTRADILANEGIGNVSPKFLSYSRMRGDANKYYNIATTISYLIVANHVFSALEAALNASKINHRIQLQGHIQSRRVYGNMVEFVPTLCASYEL